MAEKSTTSLVKVNVNNPQSMAKFANVLKDFIVQKKLYSNIKGKNYVNVEGWEFAGSSMGILPIVRSCDRIEVAEGGEIKYKARVELINIAKGTVVGAGEAICSNKEKSKTSFEEYAISSMAQTRAIGKAYRNTFAWLMKMAGYEVTPVEEMQYEEQEKNQVIYEPIETIQDRVAKKLDSLGSVDRLKAIKSTGHTDVKKLSETNWRRLDSELGTDKPEIEQPVN